MRRFARMPQSIPSSAPNEEAAPIYLVSAAGIPNYGDEFITVSWLRYLARTLPHRDVWLDCPEPGRAAVLLAGVHPRLRTLNTLWQLPTLLPEDHSSSERLGLIDKWVREGGTPRLDPGLRLLHTVEHVHVLGGGYVNSIWPQNIAIIEALAALNRHHDVRLHGTGMGLEPLTGVDLSAAVDAFAVFDSLEVRDSPSAASMPTAVFGLDDAFLAAGDQTFTWDGDELPDTMIVLQGDFELGDEVAVSELLGEFLARPEVTSECVGLVEGLTPDDVRWLPVVERLCANVRVFSFLEIWDRGIPAIAGQNWLSTRFHFHLLAAARGAAGVVVSPDREYYDVKHGSLTDLGTGWRTVAAMADVRDLTPSHNPNFIAQVNALTKRKLEIADSIYGQLA